MDFTKLSKNVTVNLNQDELKILIDLKEKKIKTIEIFRRGLLEYIKDFKSGIKS